jgi:Rrf2 family protein
MRVSAKLDYGLRALVELASAEGELTTADVIAGRQHISVQFLQNILTDLRVAGIVATRRGAEGGYRLARPAHEIRVGDVVRVLDGPFGTVNGIPMDALQYDGAASGLAAMWSTVQSALTAVLDGVTLADVVSGELPLEPRSVVAP